MINNIPEFLYHLLIEQYGENLTNTILDGYSKKRPVTLRANTLKTSITDIKPVFDHLHISYKEVSWYKDALILENISEKQIKNLLVGVWGNSTKKEKREKSTQRIFLFFCENVDFCNACSSSMSNLKTVSNFQNCKIFSLSKNRKPKILQKQISPSLEKTVY